MNQLLNNNNNFSNSTNVNNNNDINVNLSNNINNNNNNNNTQDGDCITKNFKSIKQSYSPPTQHHLLQQTTDKNSYYQNYQTQNYNIFNNSNEATTFYNPFTAAAALNTTQYHPIYTNNSYHQAQQYQQFTNNQYTAKNDALINNFNSHHSSSSVSSPSSSSSSSSSSSNSSSSLANNQKLAYNSIGSSSLANNFFQQANQTLDNFASTISPSQPMPYLFSHLDSSNNNNNNNNNSQSINNTYHDQSNMLHQLPISQQPQRTSSSSSTSSSSNYRQNSDNFPTINTNVGLLSNDPSTAAAQANGENINNTSLGEESTTSNNESSSSKSKPVIYAWMKKVHINNSSKLNFFLLNIFVVVLNLVSCFVNIKWSYSSFFFIQFNKC
jgi:hypothetical protein